VTTSVREVRVRLNFGDETLSVGRLAMHKHKIYFEYDTAFCAHGLELSPLRLPIGPGVRSFDNHLFEGLPGVFNDSLPDGWGRLLFDRFVRFQGLLPEDLTPLDRLVRIGADGLGALIYEPDCSVSNVYDDIRLDTLAIQARNALRGAAEDVLEELMSLNGSSAGARPKALIGVNDARDRIVHGACDIVDGYTPWIVKFPNSRDGLDAGAIEYTYAVMAKEAGISMPEVHLFPAQNGPGYFGIQRFDREGRTRFHVHTACGLLHSDFRVPSLDYSDLVALAGALTRDVREVEKVYQLAVFNVLAHNRDDHSKNFSFLMDRSGMWMLSPAYDLTFSSGPGGEQSTMVMGEGRNPCQEHLLSLAEEAKIKRGHALDIIERTRMSLEKWPELASQYGVRHENVELMKQKCNLQHKG